MRHQRLFIAGDWGTTSVRVSLCDGTQVLGRAEGPGVADRSATPPRIFEALTAPWTDAHGPLPAYLCGMVGSTLGWQDVPYLPCPAGGEEAGAGALRFTHQDAPVAILPGLSCTNPLGAPDVMRGEETQVFGALALLPESQQGRHVFILPGTHTKWVLVQDGRIATFQTALTGEMFALLRDHSTLGRGNTDPLADADDGFMLGVRRQAAQRDVSLTHLLFEVRSRQLIESLSREKAMAYLSGLLIGADAASGVARFGAGDCTIIGEPALADLYDAALRLQGAASVRVLNGAACALAGVRDAFKEEVLF